VAYTSSARSATDIGDPDVRHLARLRTSRHNFQVFGVLGHGSPRISHVSLPRSGYRGTRSMSTDTEALEQLLLRAARLTEDIRKSQGT
jgi:hypothetical protein